MMPGEANAPSDGEGLDETLEAAIKHPGRDSATIDNCDWWSGENGSKFNVSKWKARGTTNAELLAVLAGEAEFRLGRQPPPCLAPVGNGPFGNYPGVQTPAMGALVRAEFDWYERVGMAEQCPPNMPVLDFVQVVSPWNSVWKPGKEGIAVRPVFDTSASGLNDCLLQWPFTLPQRGDVLREMYPGCVLGLRDMQWGFYHCRVSVNHRRYLGFRHPFTGTLWRFRALPFGVKHSPALFCMVTNEFRRLVLQELERRGHRRWVPDIGSYMRNRGARGADKWVGKQRGRYTIELLAYVDDFPIIAATPFHMEQAFRAMDELAAELGITFNPSKDQGRPALAELSTPATAPAGSASRHRSGSMTTLKILGALFESQSDPGPAGCVVRATVPSDKRAKYLAALQQLVRSAGRSRRVRVSHLATTAGQLAFCASLMRWGKTFTASFYATLGGHHRGYVTLGRDLLRQDIPFWLDYLHPSAPWRGLWQWSLLDLEDFKIFRPLQVASDASHWGMGGVWGLESFAARWPQEDTFTHIAWLELHAIVQSVERWAPEWTGHAVLFHCDNTQAVSYVNRGGGRLPEGQQLVRRLAKALEQHQPIELRAVHIAGEENGRPDRISRGKEQPTTSDYTFARFSEFNTVPHEVDAACSADGLNAQPGTSIWFSAVDSFLDPTALTRIEGRRVWATPPFELVGEFLEQLVEAWRRNPRTTATVVVPRWEGKWWWRRFFVRNTFRVLAEFPADGSTSVFWVHEALRKRRQLPKPQWAGPLKWPVVVATFPTLAVDCGAPARARRKRQDPARSLCN